MDTRVRGSKNRPFGAVFAYHLGAELETAQKTRREKEKELSKEGKDVPFPGIETLEAESLEDEPKIVLEVRDAANQIVRRVEGPTTKGFHRVAWDLRYPPPNPVELKPHESSPRSGKAIPQALWRPRARIRYDS